VGGEAFAQLLDGRRPIGHERYAVACQLAVPGRQRARTGAASANAGQQRIALRECSCVCTTGGDPRGAERGDHLVQVRAA
jgi:hypothetical protein